MHILHDEEESKLAATSEGRRRSLCRVWELQGHCGVAAGQVPTSQASWVSVPWHGMDGMD